MEPLHQLKLVGEQAQLASNGSVYRRRVYPRPGAKPPDAEAGVALDRSPQSPKGGGGQAVRSSAVRLGLHATSSLEGPGPSDDGPGRWSSAPALFLNHGPVGSDTGTELPVQLDSPSPQRRRTNHCANGSGTGGENKHGNTR